MLALARAGVDGGMRIVGAPGTRPVLRNVSREAVEHFRRAVEVVDLVGATEAREILAKAGACAARNPGAAETCAAVRSVGAIEGYVPGRMVSDPAGYFVVFPDRARRWLVLEHYGNDGVLDVVIEGASAAELYWPAVERGLVSRLEHAAYLGRELARAEAALRTGEPFVQDAAPESGKRETSVVFDPGVFSLSKGKSGCGCGGKC